MLFARRALVLFSMAAVPVFDEAAAQSWQTYVNPRYGFSIDYPPQFRAAPPPANGDGRDFAATDEAHFSVYGELNNPGGKERTIPEFEEYIRDSSGSDYSHVTYRFADAGILVLSGVRGDRVFYEKYILSQHGQIVNAFVMTYPTGAKALYDAIAARMSKSFHPG